MFIILVWFEMPLGYNQLETLSRQVKNAYQITFAIIKRFKHLNQTKPLTPRPKKTTLTVHINWN